MSTEVRQTFVLPRVGQGDRGRAIERLAGFLRALGADAAWRVDITRARKRRSDQQNRALWGVAYKTLADATGNDPEDLHMFFLGEHFGWEVIEVMGQKRRVPKRRSSKLNTVEFMGFYDFIQRRAAECGYYIPSPNEDAFNA